MSGTGAGKGLGVLGIDYYRRAVAMLRERNPGATLYVFSDDIDAVRRDFMPEGPHHFVCCPGSEQPYESMRLMALCDQMVIANSTFSWWAAWLNPKQDKLIIAPEPWFGDGREGQGDIVPEAWKRLPR